MQLFLIALVLGLFLYDEFYPAPPEAFLLPAGLAALATLVPMVLLAGLYGLLCRATLRRLGRPAGMRWLRRLDHAGVAYRFSILGLYGLGLSCGLPHAIRGAVGDLVLVDELILLAPPLALLVWSWWIYYPIDRRIREAGLIGRVDAGLPVYPIWTRGQFILAQLRHQVALILAPLLAIMAWTEAVERLPAAAAAWQGVLTGAGVVAVLLLAPVALRHLWDTAPLPQGELRSRLLHLCGRHRVRVRELLLWRTYGGMINAAVMGFFGPVRYILLTDALLDMLRREQVEAVMAHELAHVRRRHMPWLLASAVATLGLLEVGLHLTLWAMWTPAPSHPQSPYATAGWSTLPFADEQVATVVLTLIAAGAWAGIFGWISRRVERQADTFAVQSMVMEREQPDRDDLGRVVVDATSAQAMVSALAAVARLNHIPPTRRSWRHGSIAWRQAYLRTLIGQPVDALAVDRQMRRIQAATIVGGGVLLFLYFAPAAWFQAIGLG